MSISKAITDVKPKLDTGLKAKKILKAKKAVTDTSTDGASKSHEDGAGSNSIMKVKITTKPKLDTGSSSRKTHDTSVANDKNNAVALKRVTIADLCEEEKSKVYNIIEQLVTLTNEHEAIVAQMTREKEQYDAELTRLNSSFSNHLLPIEEAIKHKDETIISLETKNHMILAMLALYQAKIQNMSDINQFYLTNEAELQTKITLFKNEVDHVKGLNSALQQRIDNMETMAAANVAVISAATQKAETHAKHLEAQLESERRATAEAQSKSISLQNQTLQLQIELENVKSELSSVSRARTVAENTAAKWKTIAETVGSHSNNSSNASSGGAVLKNPYRRHSTAVMGSSGSATTEKPDHLISQDDFDVKPSTAVNHSTVNSSAVAVGSGSVSSVEVKQSESEPIQVERKKKTRKASVNPSDVLSGSVTGLLEGAALPHSSAESLPGSGSIVSRTKQQPSVVAAAAPSLTVTAVLPSDVSEVTEPVVKTKSGVVKKKVKPSRVVSSRVPASGGVMPVVDSGSGNSVNGVVSQPQQRSTVGAIFERNNRTATSANGNVVSAHTAGVGGGAGGRSVVVMMPSTGSTGNVSGVGAKKTAASAASSGVVANRGGSVDYDLKLFDVLGQM